MHLKKNKVQIRPLYCMRKKLQWQYSTNVTNNYQHVKNLKSIKFCHQLTMDGSFVTFYRKGRLLNHAQKATKKHVVWIVYISLTRTLIDTEANNESICSTNAFQASEHFLVWLMVEDAKSLVSILSIVSSVWLWTLSTAHKSILGM